MIAGIPSIMWSDIINNTQRLHPGATVSFLASFRRLCTFQLGSGGHGSGHQDYYQHLDVDYSSGSPSLWACSGLRVDYIRLTFVLFVCSYAINELVVIASFLQYLLQHRNVSDFVNHSTLYRVHSDLLFVVVGVYFVIRCAVYTRIYIC
jgi:hypothetical protein